MLEKQKSLMNLIDNKFKGSNSTTQPWRWRHYAPPKRWYAATSPHGVTTPKNEPVAFTPLKLCGSILQAADTCASPGLLRTAGGHGSATWRQTAGVWPPSGTTSSGALGPHAVALCGWLLPCARFLSCAPKDTRRNAYRVMSFCGYATSGSGCPSVTCLIFETTDLHLN